MTKQVFHWLKNKTETACGIVGDVSDVDYPGFYSWDILCNYTICTTCAEIHKKLGKPNQMETL